MWRYRVHISPAAIWRVLVFVQCSYFNLCPPSLVGIPTLPCWEAQLTSRNTYLDTFNPRVGAVWAICLSIWGNKHLKCPTTWVSLKIYRFIRRYVELVSNAGTGAGCCTHSCKHIVRVRYCVLNLVDWFIVYEPHLYKRLIFTSAGPGAVGARGICMWFFSLSSAGSRLQCRVQTTGLPVQSLVGSLTLGGAPVNQKSPLHI